MGKLLQSIKKQKTRMKYLTEFALNPFKNYKHDKTFRMNMQYAYYYDKLKINEKMVLFETSHGSKLGGNPYAIFKSMFENSTYKKFTFILVLNEKDNYYAKQYSRHSNVKIVKRDSQDYLKYLAQAKYLINDTTFPFYFQKKEGQVYVNTWHGTPLKTLGKDVKGTLGQHKNAIRNFLHADYIINPNRFTADILVNAHELNEIYNGKIADEGYPRMDLTFHADKTAVKKQLEEVVGFELNKKIVLYAPTWRGEIGKVSKADEELIQHIKEIKENMPDDYIFLLKVHDLTYKMMKNNAELQQLCLPDWLETNELLSVVDVLITDYSSIFFDFLVTKKPILFFAYDREQYERERGFYLNLDDMPGPICENVEDVITSIETIENVQLTYKECYEKMIAQYSYHDDGKATERFLDMLFNGRKSDYIYPIVKRNKIKLLIYGGGFTTNGVTTSLLNLLKHMDYNRYDVTIMYGGKMTEAIQANLEKLDPNVRILYRMGTFNFRLMEYYKHRYIMKSGLVKDFIQKNIPKNLYQKEWHRLVGDATFDIGIDFSGYSPLWSLLIAFNDFHRKSTYLHSDMVADSNRVINGKKAFKLNFDIIFHLYKYYDKLICVSKEVTDINKKKLKSYNVVEKIINVDNSIDYHRVLDHVDEGETEVLFDKEQLVIRKELTNGILSFSGVEMPTKDNINFVSLGRLSPEKDHEKLIKAFSKVNKLFECTRLYIIGDGALKPKLTQLIIGLGLEGKVFLVGEMENPFILLNKCDCFIMSSNYEGQGLVVLEALILNKPVISTDIPGPRGILEEGLGELVENSESGLIYGMTRFIVERPVFESFDYIAYNENAMKKFYEKVCDSKRLKKSDA